MRRLKQIIINFGNDMMDLIMLLLGNPKKPIVTTTKPIPKIKKLPKSSQKRKYKGRKWIKSLLMTTLKKY